MAVKVTLVPIQIGLTGKSAILTAGVTGVFTTTVALKFIFAVHPPVVRVATTVQAPGAV